MNKLFSKPLFRIMLCLFIVISSISILDISVNAEENTPQPIFTQRVFDYANILTDDEIESLEKLSYKYSQKRNIDFVILTTNDSDYSSIDSYAQNFVKENGFDYSDNPDRGCAIVTIGMTLRDVNVSGYSKAQTQLDNSRCSMIRERITPLLTNGNYYKAFSKFIKLGQRYVTVKPGVSPENILLQSWFQLLAAVIIGSITVGCMAYNSGGKTTTNSATYLDNNSSRTVASHDTYIRTSTTRTKRQSSSSSGGGGGGGGGGHSSSSGKF